MPHDLFVVDKHTSGGSVQTITPPLASILALSSFISGIAHHRSKHHVFPAPQRARYQPLRVVSVVVKMGIMWLWCCSVVEIRSWRGSWLDRTDAVAGHRNASVIGGADLDADSAVLHYLS